MNKYSALIVAAGRGTRAGGGLPKQYRNLNGKPMLVQTINALLAHPDIKEIVCVIDPTYQADYNRCAAMIDDTRLSPAIAGGQTRSESVKNGLKHIKSDVVLIHDGARPLVPVSSLSRLMNEFNNSEAAFLALPVTDALWVVDGVQADHSVSRDKYWRAQTPQAFKTKDILSAHTANTSPVDDDVATARAAGLKVTPVIGDDINIKITKAEDFVLAEKLMGSKMDIRTGNGYDVHALGKGDHVILNGIKIPHTHSMIGHSDADVAMHTITDALFGAIADGDIGQWFPPSDSKWKGASSDIFLRKAVERCLEKGFKISNIDCTIICEAPKIGPHALNMRQNLATILGIEIDRISVKATTSEKLGFTGRGEGIAAQATATLVKT